MSGSAWVLFCSSVYLPFTRQVDRKSGDQSVVSSWVLIMEKYIQCLLANLSYSIINTNGPSTLINLVKRKLERCVPCQHFFRLKIDSGFGQASQRIKYLCSGQSLVVAVMMLSSLL